jgi:hypothetical protein
MSGWSGNAPITLKIIALHFVTSICIRTRAIGKMWRRPSHRQKSLQLIFSQPFETSFFPNFGIR